MTRRIAFELLFAAALTTLGTACHSRPSRHHSRASQELTHRPSSVQGRALRHLCGDLGAEPCVAACPSSLPPKEHAECLIEFRFAHDAEALDLARSLYAKTGVLPGVDVSKSQSTYTGERVPTTPALPIGEDRQHLAWIIASFERYDAVFSTLAAQAPAPIDFSLRPDAFVFFRTQTKTYPSAWGEHGVVGYNLEGPLHTSERDVLETLFHELFHLNDERRGGWSNAALGDVFSTIVSRCGGDHECLTGFAPYDTCVPDGTYYPFDERTRDVREYGAELALRWYLEHEAVLAGAPVEPPFKCGTDENRSVWDRITQDFFGGLDLTRECERVPDTGGS